MKTAIEKCSHCGHLFQPVWFQREDLGVRRERHERRCLQMSVHERQHYLRHGRWPVRARASERRQDRSGRTRKTPARPQRPAATPAS